MQALDILPSLVRYIAAVVPGAGRHVLGHHPSAGKHSNLVSDVLPVSRGLNLIKTFHFILHVQVV